MSADGSVGQSPVDPFRVWAGELGQWMRSAGGLPDRLSADEYERKLSRWRSRQVNKLTAGALSPERQECLDTAAPGWRPPQTRSEAFRGQAEALGSWLLSTGGRAPDRQSADARERHLADWRYTQLRHLGTGKLSPERQEYLDKVAPGWRPKPQITPEGFRARAEELGRWLCSAGVAPSSKSADAHERRLASWRRTQRDRLDAGTLPPERRECLDEVAPGWCTVLPRRGGGVACAGADDRFRARAEELGRWMRSAGRTPYRSSTDPHEQRLAQWKKSQLHRLRAGTLSPEREECLDEAAPGWRPTQLPPAYCARAEELGRWMRTAGRTPSRLSADEDEVGLAKWRTMQVNRLGAGTLPTEREAYLDEVAAGWRPRPRVGRDGFGARAEELGRWMRSAGKAPSSSSADTYERRLAVWRYRQLEQLRVGTLSPEREACLDEVADGWRPASTSTPQWFRSQADELGRWIAAAGGRVPSQSSDDPHERRLSVWRHRQLSRLRHKKLPPEREQYLDETVPGWRPQALTGLEGFRARAQELGQWMTQHGGTAPSRRGRDPLERRLGEWRQVQFSRLRRARLPVEREQYLDEVAAGWRPRAVPGIEGFRSRAEALGRWMASHGGTVPSRLSEDTHERRLGMWRRRQVFRLRHQRLSTERALYLDEVAPGWRARDRGRAVEFPERARGLGRWMVWSDGNVPDARSDDWYERRINRWRRTWLAQLRTGTLLSEHERYLDEVAPGWRPRAGSGVDEFPARAEALGRWFASADGRLPSSRSDDLHERRMHRWRQGWVFHLRNGTLSPERERYLDDVAPGWRPRRRDAGEIVQAQEPAGQQEAQVVRTATDPRGRRLTAQLPAETPTEGRGWVSEERAPEAGRERAASWSPSPYRVVASRMNQSPEESFRAQAQALGSWLASSGGRLPDLRSADADERRLANRRSQWHRQLGAGTLPLEWEACLDEVAPGWRPQGREAFRAQAVELGRWLQSTGRVPSRRSAGADERRLADWRHRQLERLDVGRLSPQHEECLDQVAPGWRAGAFRAQANELGRWLRLGGTLPSSGSADEYERRLAGWRGHQLRQLGAGTLPPGRERYLDRVAPGWRPRHRGVAEIVQAEDAATGAGEQEASALPRVTPPVQPPAQTLTDGRSRVDEGQPQRPAAVPQPARTVPAGWAAQSRDRLAGGLRPHRPPLWR